MTYHCYLPASDFALLASGFDSCLSPASLDVRPQARGISHDDRKREDIAQERCKGKERTARYHASRLAYTCDSQLVSLLSPVSPAWLDVPCERCVKEHVKRQIRHKTGNERERMTASPV